MLDLLKPYAIVNYYCYPKDVFTECEDRRVEAVTLEHWAASKKGQGG